VFLLGYFATSPLFGTLGDRVSRKRLIAFGVVTWSLATIASGIAGSLLTLLAARIVVGVGEASYATLAPTIIDDITPPDKKCKDARDLLPRGARRLRARLPRGRLRPSIAGLARGVLRGRRPGLRARADVPRDRGAGAQAGDDEGTRSPRAGSAS